VESADLDAGGDVFTELRRDPLFQLFGGIGAEREDK
jgi:hypothetical protein